VGEDMDSQQFYDGLAQGREEGRREVLREIAKLDPIEQNSDHCYYCGSWPGDPMMREAHEPTCLWLQAQAVKDAE
jgi:hypothetical protein